MIITAVFFVLLLTLLVIYLYVISVKPYGVIPKKGTKLIIFDFDGTICDSYDLILKIFNSIAYDYGIKRVELSKKLELKNKSIKEVMKDHGVTLSMLPSLTRRVRKELSSNTHKLNAFYNIKEVIQSLKNKGYAIGILTTNSGSNVKTFLEANDMVNLFQFIVHGSSLYGKGKLLQYIIKRSNFAKYYYVGDEVRDIDAARNKENMYSVAVTWGYNSKTLLQSHDTDYIVDTPLDLINIIE